MLSGISLPLLICCFFNLYILIFHCCSIYWSLLNFHLFPRTILHFRNKDRSNRYFAAPSLFWWVMCDCWAVAVRSVKIFITAFSSGHRLESKLNMFFIIFRGKLEIWKETHDAEQRHHYAAGGRRLSPLMNAALSPIITSSVKWLLIPKCATKILFSLSSHVNFPRIALSWLIKLSQT